MQRVGEIDERGRQERFEREIGRIRLTEET